jgi:hypothetical protein
MAVGGPDRGIVECSHDAKAACELITLREIVHLDH